MPGILISKLDFDSIAKCVVIIPQRCSEEKDGLLVTVSRTLIELLRVRFMVIPIKWNGEIVTSHFCAETNNHLSCMSVVSPGDKPRDVHPSI